MVLVISGFRGFSSLFGLKCFSKKMNCFRFVCMFGNEVMFSTSLKA